MGRRPGELPGGILTHLLAYARNRFRDGQVVKGGSTRGAHERQYLKSLPRKEREKLEAQGAVEAAEAPGELPGGTEWIFSVFCELRRARSHGFAAEDVGFRDIESWERLHGVELSPWQVRAIRALDELWFEVMDDGGSRRARAEDQEPRGGSG